MSLHEPFCKAAWEMSTLPAVDSQVRAQISVSSMSLARQTLSVKWHDGGITHHENRIEVHMQLYLSTGLSWVEQLFYLVSCSIAFCYMSYWPRASRAYTRLRSIPCGQGMCRQD